MPNTESKDLQIPLQFSHVEKALSELDENLNNLHTRLSAVSTRYPRDTERKEEAMPEISPVAGDLRHIYDRINSHVGTVAVMISELEV